MVVSIEWFVMQNVSMDALILVLAARLVTSLMDGREAEL